MEYGLSELKKGLQDPYLIARELNTQYHRQRGSNWYNVKGTGIFDLDWDNLILLDACRFDVFEKHVQLPGTISYRHTLGSRTPEFIRANFTDRQEYGMIYISENGWYERLKDDIGSAVFKSTLQTDQHFPSRHEQTTEIALELSKEYPNKRLLIHYLPPHHPYYGPLAEEHLPEEYNRLFKQIRNGEIDISDETLRKIYVENFERILPHVSDLLESLSGKTVISSDHGEYLGERSFPIPVKMYGHNPTTYTEELTKVPWYVHESESRKSIQEELPEEKEDKEILDQDLDEHLRHLGYKV